jgi:hypothetical protein
MAIRRDRDGRPDRQDDKIEKPTRVLKRGDADQTAAELRPPVSAKPGEHTHVYGMDVLAESDPVRQNPVVGWLVIISGPGRGQALTLGYGLNSIGRGAEARVRLDFGDRQISRESHALLSYDPRGRRFYLQHGGGTNLTYLNDQPVLTPTELPNGAVILMGKTELRFVAFCGPAFDWQDTDPGAS